MNRNHLLIVGSLLLVYFIGFGINIMDVDAAQYASMSREMLRSGNYLHVYDTGIEYLDKPPFLFWISALSMKIFGINNFAYRLPSFLFALLAVLSTYKLAKLFYNQKTALLSALILATSQGFFLMNHDVRTDTILMGCVAFSVWQLSAWYQTNKIWHFILGSIGIGIGMMTKGPIALLVPCFGFFSHFLLQRNFKAFFKWEYILAILIIGVLLIPMSWGLYDQFDLYPNKIVNGKTGVSGLRFFYWTQSFGRITGESVWNNGAGIGFLLQNMLWSFLPWILFFIVGLIWQIKNILQQKLSINKTAEAICIGGFILTYLSLGMSKYQLPHYIFVGFPFAAIITAVYLNHLFDENQDSRWLKIFTNVHVVLFSLLWIAVILLLKIPFDTIHVLYFILAIVLFVLMIYYFSKIKTYKNKLIFVCVFTIIGLNLFLNAAIYPALLEYQTGSTMGKYIKKNNINPENLFTYQFSIMRSIHFYSDGFVREQNNLDSINSGDFIITTEEKLKEFSNAKKEFSILKNGEDFGITRLSLIFLNPKTRKSVVTKYALIKIN
jgi:4-amino-4-deoxy-L-arabinose transferase-like glycosyltransferase